MFVGWGGSTAVHGTERWTFQRTSTVLRMCTGTTAAAVLLYSSSGKHLSVSSTRSKVDIKAVEGVGRASQGSSVLLPALYTLQQSTSMIMPVGLT